LRSKVKEIIMSRKDGQVMIEGSPDTALVRAVLAFHPRASEKMVGIKGIKVDTSNHDAAANGKKSRCFHLIKEDDTSEDVSMMKCFAELERKLNAGEITAEGETKPAAEGKDAEVSVEAEKTADAEAEKKADAEAEKTADAEAEKTADAEATPEATPEAEKADAAASAA
jgi:hypothetical protein